MELNAELITQISNTVLKNSEDLKELETLCSQITPTIDILLPLLKVLENNPDFKFGEPGNIIRILEKYYQEERYRIELFASIKRVPTEYNIWMLNRLLNTYDEEDKIEGIALLKDIIANPYILPNVKEWAEEYLDEQEG